MKCWKKSWKTSNHPPQKKIGHKYLEHQKNTLKSQHLSLALCDTLSRYFPICASVSIIKCKTGRIILGSWNNRTPHVRTFIFCNILFFSFPAAPYFPSLRNTGPREASVIVSNDRTPEAITAWLHVVSVANQVQKGAIRYPHLTIKNDKHDNKRPKVEIRSGTLHLAHAYGSTMLGLCSRQLREISVSICQQIIKHHSDIIPSEPAAGPHRTLMVWLSFKSSHDLVNIKWVSWNFS